MRKTGDKNDTLYRSALLYEEEALPETVRILSDKYFALMRKGMISEESRILFVDDGSSDDTWNMIKEYHEKKPIFCGLKPVSYTHLTLPTILLV